MPGAAYRLSWRDNRVVATSAFDGRGRRARRGDRSGHGSSHRLVDRALARATRHRAHPGCGAARAANAVAHVTFVRRRLHDQASRRRGSRQRAGARRLARARRLHGGRPRGRGARERVGPSRDGAPASRQRRPRRARRGDGSLLHTVPLGVVPVSAVVSADGATAWVSVLGGAKPTSGERAATQCCDPRAESVRVDARGIAARGTVSRVDLVTGRVTARHRRTATRPASRGTSRAPGSSSSTATPTTSASSIRERTRSSPRSPPIRLPQRTRRRRPDRRRCVARRCAGCTSRSAARTRSACTTSTRERPPRASAD